MPTAPKTKYAILGALTINPMSGYDIKEWVAKVTGSFWAESPGQVYPCLANLLKEGLVKCDESQAKGNRPRKVYSITKKGIKVLSDWLKMPVEHSVFRDELVLKLFYGKNMGKEDCISLIEQERTFVENRLREYESVKNHIKEEHSSQLDSFYWQLTLKKALYHAEVELKWCDEVIKSLKRLKRIK